MHLRAENPALWRGTASFHSFSPTGNPAEGSVLVVTKRDTLSTNAVAVIFSDIDVLVPLAGINDPVEVKAWQPVFVKLS